MTSVPICHCHCWLLCCVLTPPLSAHSHIHKHNIPCCMHTHTHTDTHTHTHTHTRVCTHTHTYAGGTAELIKEELYGIGDEFRVNCPGDLLRLCLTNQCREFHSFTFLGNMSSLSDQSKFICFVDDTRVVNITYVLSDHQPIRLVQPQIQILSPELQDVVVIPCAATGYPAPNVTLLKWDTLNENFVNLPESVDHYFRTFSPSNISYVMTYHILLGDQGRYLCQAVNIWEKQNVTVYVHETPETNPNSCEVAPSVTPPTPKHSGMLSACDICPISVIVTCTWLSQCQMCHTVVMRNVCHVTAVWCLPTLLCHSCTPICSYGEHQNGARGTSRRLSSD